MTQPIPIRDTVYVAGGPSGIYNPDCDTLSILNRYGSIIAEKDDSLYQWRVEYDAVTRRLRVSENRPPDIKIIPIETNNTKTEIRTWDFWQYVQVLSVGAVVGIGLLLIGMGFLKR